ncbi:MLH3 [Symbiodinium sp. CCMP2592]|nr:MLH3 [Symbiodinium sp. CCMP2592]
MPKEALAEAAAPSETPCRLHWSAARCRNPRTFSSTREAVAEAMKVAINQVGSPVAKAAMDGQGRKFAGAQRRQGDGGHSLSQFKARGTWKHRMSSCICAPFFMYGGVWLLFVLNFQCSATGGSRSASFRCSSARSGLGSAVARGSAGPCTEGTSEPQKAPESTWKRTRCYDAANIVPLLAQRIAVARGPAAPCQTMSPEGTARPQIKELIPPIAAIEAFEKEIRIFAGNNHSTLPQPSPALRRRQSS